MNPIKHIRVLPLVAVALVPALVLMTGCGGKQASARSASADTTTRPASADTTITIHANDFLYQLDTQTVTAGPVHVVFINDSHDYNHEVWLYPQDQPKLEDLLAAKRSGQDVDEEDYLQGIAGKVEDVGPGQTASFDVTLDPGTYELACFIASKIADQLMVHYDMGMHVLVTAAAQ